MSATLEEIQNFKGKYPKQLWYLFFSEMWERFSFYGMRGMLVIFMVSQLMMDEKTANLQYGATQAFVYAFTFIGGLFADKILGYRKSLFWGGLLMIVGSIILALDPKQFFFFGISFTIIGTGFFKPNISTMVGKLYKDDDNRRDAGFSLFYAGVNLGALIGGYICIAVANGNMFASYIPEHLRWNVAFGFAAIVMIVSLLTFTQTQKSMGEIGLSPLNHLEPSKKRTFEMVTYVGSLVIIPVIMTMVAKTEYTDYFMFVIGPASLLYLFYEMRNFSLAENKKLMAALVFIIFSIFFWAFFEQSGGSLSLFAANNLDNTVAGIKLDPNGVNNSANSLFVIAFAALIGMVWLWMNKRKIEPNTVVKFGLAFLFLAGGFYVFYYTKFFADASGRTSLDLFTFGWFVITFGELCLSPIGMSAMTKLSPQKTQAVIMGMWFLASAYGQYFAGLLGANIAEASENASNLDKLNVYADGYEQLAIYALVAGVILIAISPLVKKLMQDVK
ncbi:Di-/tripeptide transporter [Flavobacterium cauense R2A-7]|uniref:POT family proton-dependent oligopeptide transporter n=1 Tax=Flavobacterium cauense R2A-7 TaxID=1341154 RepID=V6S5G8_9FLAO|nr:peptide MFS transporter [Flavobacterium cauense]ESU21649.1 Di-/tripeptide transporter [Flavobacterium cauense R2A-7]KGO80105.1 amino acid transporter [Flavobacterium cauense R2A-7]TWI10413.1 POT family proton-dependent oligopeptide transporter [Flavobacterium cauense R2A-7]